MFEISCVHIRAELIWVHIRAHHLLTTIDVSHLCFVLFFILLKYSWFCWGSVTQSGRILCDPMDYNMPAGFPILHCLPEFAQADVHWIGDAIQPSHSLSPLLLLPSVFPSISVFSNESSLHIWWPKCWCFSSSISPSSGICILQWSMQDWFHLRLTGCISLLSKGLSRVFSNPTVQKHSFLSTQPLWANSHVCTWLLEKLYLWVYKPFWPSDGSAF